MNKDQFEGNWKQFKGKVKEKWGKFSDDEVTRMDGKYDQFVGHLQEKYGYDKERAQKEIENWDLPKSNRGDEEFKNDEDKRKRKSA